MDKVGMPFSNSKPVLDQKRGMSIDGMQPVKRVSDEKSDPNEGRTKAGQFVGGSKDLGSQIPVKK